MEQQIYKIKVDKNTVYYVNKLQLFRDKWVNYFGGVESVKNFIKNYQG